MRAILEVLMIALDAYLWLIIGAAILSWLIVFQVVNTRNQVVNTIWTFLYNITEPALRPIRRFVPNLGGIDISPVVLILGIILVQKLIVYSILPLVV